jgi:hypothetical protein
MKLFGTRILWITLSCFCFINLNLAQNTEIIVTPLLDILGDVASVDELSTAVISPDGATIAWYKEMDTASICLYSFQVTEAECYADTSGINWTPTSGLWWSPDSHYIAFHRNWGITQGESDMLVFNTENYRFINLTDDGVDRLNFLTGEWEGEEGKTPVFDILPVWNPAIPNELYFFRIDTNNDTRKTDLYVVNIESGEPQLVQELTIIDAVGLPIWDVIDADIQVLSGRAAISPDGTYLAVIVLSNIGDASNNGIWLLNLLDEVPPQQITSSMPSDEVFPDHDDVTMLHPSGLGWLSDSTLIYSVSTFMDAPYRNLYTVNVESGNITPMMDFSTYSSSQFEQPDETGYAPLSRLPDLSVFNAETETVLTLGWDNANVIVTQFTDFDEPNLGIILTVLPQSEAFFPMERVSLSNNGKAIMQGHLIELPE